MSVLRTFAVSLMFATAPVVQAGGCLIGGVTIDGDSSLVTITDSGIAGLPCHVSYLGQTPDRGRINYTTMGGGGEPSRSDSMSLQDNVLRLFGEVSTKTDSGSGEQESSIFGMRLGNSREMRVALRSAIGGYQLQVTVFDQAAGSSSVLGAVAVDASGIYSLEFHKAGALKNQPLTLVLVSGELRAAFAVPGKLSTSGMSGWRYGLLDDPGVDNNLAYSWYTNHGPAPVFSAR